MAFFTTSEKILSLHPPCCYLWLLPFVLLLRNCEIWFPHDPLWVPEVVIRCPLNLLFSRPHKQLPQCLCAYLMFQFPHSISGPWLHCLQLVNLSLELQSLRLSMVSQKLSHKGITPGLTLLTALSLRQSWTWLFLAAGRMLSWARYVPACSLVLSQSLWWPLKL